ncbi:MAG TPA: YitT family protein [Symbiobacteriaceae bacterium]|nr:YitT family protein [Symbiobacteriaceae bacterium]
MLWLIPCLSGALLMALSVNGFLVPVKLAEGGVVGIGIILQHKVGVPIWVTTLALNVPIVAIGVRYKGWNLLWKSLVGVGAFSGFLAVTQNVPHLTNQPILAIVYGGLLMGLGLGLVLRSGGTTGGTDILAIVGQQKLGLSVGTMVMGVDALVLLAAGFAFSAESAMWSAITLLISSKVVDLVQEGFYAAKGVTIITTEPKAIAARIMDEVERGCTILPGVGAYTGQPRSVLYIVVQRGELTRVKEIVYGIDPRAFVVVADCHEVLGEGFRTHESTAPQKVPNE